MATIEALISARWWANQLRTEPRQQSGNPLLIAFDESEAAKKEAEQTDVIDAMTAAARSASPELPAEQIDKFEIALTEIVQRDCVQGTSWLPDDPLRGSYPRAFGTDYGPDGRLREAWQVVFGDTPTLSYFPIKTIMWVNPGEVKVRNGYGAAEQVLYRDSNPGLPDIEPELMVKMCDHICIGLGGVLELFELMEPLTPGASDEW